MDSHIAAGRVAIFTDWENYFTEYGCDYRKYLYKTTKLLYEIFSIRCGQLSLLCKSTQPHFSTVAIEACLPPHILTGRQGGRLNIADTASINR
jgi:hypothetical protein